MNLSKPKYYNSIDNCPIFIFNKILQGGEIQLLVYKGNINKSKLEVYWKTLFNEYIKEYGLSPEYEEYLKINFDKKAIDEIMNNKHHYCVPRGGTMTVRDLAEQRPWSYHVEDS